MHGRKRLTFWQHHALTTLFAIPLLSLPRMIGGFGAIDDAPDIVLHSAIIVVLTHPLQIAGAYSAMRYLPNRISLSFRAIIGCVLIAPLVAFLSPLVSWFVGVGPLSVVEAASRDELVAAISARYVYRLTLYAVLGTMIWMSLNFHWWRRAWKEADPEDEAEIVQRPDADISVDAGEAAYPRFIAKLPFAKRGELWALSSELHYVRVFTSQGDDLVLMRLSDAIEQADNVDGLQIHRSHWVATHGIEHIQSKGGKMRVTLKSGDKLPVSKSHQGVVRNALADLIV